ncbi:hypothetical protein [Pacificoceanicola onchidii]|uniref:hypothetical protein n=1 Tax=Pacificoceanicola onchidii TaxID=2562685 RepID=UPI0010A5AC88|nr:hypothetical protein [Pacificoceanicola onchidii]
MARIVKNQTRSDFRRRVKSVDPSFYRWGSGGVRKDTTVERPIGSALLGFGWAYLVITIASNRPLIEQSLAQGALPEQYHVHVFMALAVLLASSGVMLLVHLMRYVTGSGGKRRNSGGLLIGVLGAVTLIYTPAHVWESGLSILDGTSRSMVQVAASNNPLAESKAMVDAIAFVNSVGR